MNGLALTRAIDWRTSWSRSEKRLGGPRWANAGVLLDLLAEFVIGEREHPAPAVVHEDDLVGAEEPLGDGERADGRRQSRHLPRFRITWGVTLAQAEDPVQVEPGVHARQDGQLLCGAAAAGHPLSKPLA